MLNTYLLLIFKMYLLRKKEYLFEQNILEGGVTLPRRFRCNGECLLTFPLLKANSIIKSILRDKW